MNLLPTSPGRRHLLALCLASCMAGADPAMAQPLPGDSVYQLDASLGDQDGKPFKLRDHLGRPMLVSMFYTSCQFVCPMLIEAMDRTRQGLSAQERAGLDLLLVSFDPERDDVKKLKSVAQARQADATQWTLARTDSGSTRKLAATLGIQYRRLADGEFNHTTAIVLLDAAGRVVGRTTRLAGADPEFIALVKKTLHSTEPAHP